MPAIAAALLLAAALPQFHGSSGAQTAGESEVVTTTSDTHDRMTVPVRIDGSGPYNFVIDTGAQNTVISTGVARQRGLKATSRATLIGVAGQQSVSLVELDGLTLGRRTFDGREQVGDGLIGLTIELARRALGIGAEDCVEQSAIHAGLHNFRNGIAPM